MSTSGAALLVVDDDVASRDQLTRRLERRGYAVATAASGDEALKYVATHQVSTVLLDAEMPGMSGLEVLHRLRQTWTASELPVLMVTGADTRDAVATALDLGANDYVSRPIDFPVALARIRNQLSRKDAEDRLRSSEQKYALAAMGANDGLWDWDLVTDVVHYSTRWKTILGCDERAIGTRPDEWFGRVHPEDLPRLRRDLDEHLSGRSPHLENEHRMRHANGAYRWVLTRGLAVRDKSGTPVRMAGSQSDITEGKVVDVLTGLPNRMLLIDRLERSLVHHRSHPGSQFAVLFLDLDGFKVVNDSLGHQMGDQLLQAVARRLEESLRTTDLVVRSGQLPQPVEHTLARLGGDEFVVLLHDVRGIVDATRVAERLQAALGRPFDLDGRQVYSTASIGISLGSGSYSKAEDVLRDADTAMYRAKALGKARAEVFDTSMREQVLSRLQLDTELRLAVERHEFMPYYQPIMELATGRLRGFEALLRWQHPVRGVVLPAEFIAVIEENGFVVPVGRRFFAEVCRQLGRWRTEDDQACHFSLNVNFAGQQFLDPRLVEDLLIMIDDAGIEPERMVVEITESSAIGNIARAVAVLERIREAGLRIVLDDFGTGYSSLSCLHELPISGLKLDRSFLLRERRHPEILKAILMLARQLGLTVTAEGVETAAQAEELRALGCDYAQGFLFARPMPPSEAGVFMRTCRR
jgi:PAS domain S-box-containing protein